MDPQIRIGNQTSIHCADQMDPFRFALENGFGAFEWFEDKKTLPDGTAQGWDETDFGADERARLRDLGRRHGVLFTVHAPWQANPLQPEGVPLLLKSVELTRDLGADLMNLHLYTEQGPDGYVTALAPVLRAAADAGLRVSIENTPHTTPEDFNKTFARLRQFDAGLARVAGMCLDIGHANLCAITRNDFIRYLDLLHEVPLIHLHVHENFGDRDSHLTLFTGPSKENDRGVRSFLKRLRARDYRGAMILEQWPNPPELLVEAERRLRELLGLPPAKAAKPESRRAATDDDLRRALIESAQAHKSWRGRLQWVRDRFSDPAFAPTPGQLATVAVYLRFLATGELACAEDGGHFRPNHCAEAALRIEEALERLTTPETAWVLRRIYPYLPSWGDEFRRAEPLTRIRDIAHRNDIPQELKREIKVRLQNKLHRCAGPEDLNTSAELLARVTAPGTDYAPAFVQEFRVFHRELEEFFNAAGLDDRLRSLAQSSEAVAPAVQAFLALKAREAPSVEKLLDVLERLTALRQALAEQAGAASPLARSQMRRADIGLEDYAFTLLGETVNHLERSPWPDAWPALLRASSLALDNLCLSHVEPEECTALREELFAWAADFRAGDSFQMTRLLATLQRARRLAEEYTDRITGLLQPCVEELGRALGVDERAIKVFSEGDVRGHVVFQLARLVDLALREARQALQLPPWEAVVPGEATGMVRRLKDLAEAEGEPGPLLVLLERADGDAEVPAGVKGIALAHPLPHLSHLGVRARQARVPFAACAVREPFQELAALAGKPMRWRVTPDGLSVHDAEVNGNGHAAGTNGTARPTAHVPEVSLSRDARVVPLDEARPETCGAKAAGAGRLVELARQSGCVFRAPRGLALPFGVMEACLEQAPEIAREYHALQGRLSQADPTERDRLLEQLRALVLRLTVPADVVRAVAEFFGPDTRLAVRSSTNGEDLEELAGAGLYESVVNVPASAVAPAVARVWASLWTRRAAVSRAQAGIAHDRVRMAVLLQELVTPELSFIMHTVNPQTGDRGEAVAELAAGLGEVLASAGLPGTPFRLVCRREDGTARLTACATFSAALRPNGDGVKRERLNYARVPLSADPALSPRLGRQLAEVAGLLERAFGRPQDVEGVYTGGEVHVVQARPQQGL